MIDFKKELENYKPIEGIDNLGNSNPIDEVQDLMDLLSHIAEQIKIVNKG